MAVDARFEMTQSDGLTKVFLNGTLVLRHSSRKPMLQVGMGEPAITAAHGSYRIRPGLRWRRPLSALDVVSRSDSGAVLRFRGTGGASLTVTIEVDQKHTGLLTARIVRDTAGDRDGVDSKDEPNRLWITLPATPGEPTHGCGEQFSRFNLRGSRVPLWTGEQGVGRGFNLTTLAANLHSGSGGHWHSTYFPQPSYVTRTGRVVHLDNSSYARFDFGRTSDVLEVWQGECTLVLGAEGSLADAVIALSSSLGRQPRLPEWTHNGMWLGLQGGSEVVRSKVAKAREAGMPLGGVWVQDWVGRRVTAFGSQLFWDWKYDHKLYPDLPDLISELSAQGVRFLGYINPFLAIEGDLYKEASPRGYCVRNADGSDYMITVTTFPAAKVDLSNPEATAWLKRVIRDNMLDVGLSGWMADYGEYLPTDAILANADALRYHNAYPAEWARLNYEAISEAGKLDDVAIFMRAGYTGSSRYAHSIWAGDQMVDWSRTDGLPSVLPAALSSGSVGIGVHHSDIGGFTSLYSRKRSKELFMRWAEFASFTPIMRSHESNRPRDNWQWDGDEETTNHLVRMVRTFAALAPYRKVVLEEYYGGGLPAMRPVVLHYPAVPTAGGAASRRPDSYLFGRDLLVRPVTRPGVSRQRVRLPEDEWVHLWSGARYGGGESVVSAAAGYPPVFYRAGSPHEALFETFRNE